MGRGREASGFGGMWIMANGCKFGKVNKEVVITVKKEGTDMGRGIPLCTPSSELQL